MYLLEFTRLFGFYPDLALFIEEFSVAYHSAYKNCDLVSSSEDFVVVSKISNPLPKNSPFKGIFNHVFRILVERGTFNKIWLKYNHGTQSKDR